MIRATGEPEGPTAVNRCQSSLPEQSQRLPSQLLRRAMGRAAVTKGTFYANVRWLRRPGPGHMPPAFLFFKLCTFFLTFLKYEIKGIVTMVGVLSGVFFSHSFFLTFLKYEIKGIVTMLSSTSAFSPQLNDSRAREGPTAGQQR